MDREAWSAAVHGSAKSRTRLSDWTTDKMRTLQRTWEKMLEGLSALWTLQSLRPTCPWTWILSYCSPHCSSSWWSLPHQRLTSCGQNGWRARSDWVPAGVHLACSTTPGEIWKRPGGVVHNAAQRPLWSPVAQQAQQGSASPPLSHREGQPGARFKGEKRLDVKRCCQW